MQNLDINIGSTLANIFPACRPFLQLLPQFDFVVVTDIGCDVASMRNIQENEIADKLSSIKQGYKFIIKAIARVKVQLKGLPDFLKVFT